MSQEPRRSNRSHPRPLHYCFSISLIGFLFMGTVITGDSMISAVNSLKSNRGKLYLSAVCFTHSNQINSQTFFFNLKHAIICELYNSVYMFIILMQYSSHLIHFTVQEMHPSWVNGGFGGSTSHGLGLHSLVWPF